MKYNILSPIYHQKKWLNITIILIAIVLLSGCQKDYFHDYIAKEKVISVTGKCALVGSLPFAQITVTPKKGYPIYLSFKNQPHLKAKLYSYCNGNQLKITGKTKVLKLTSGNKKYVFNQYVMILDHFKVIKTK